MGLAKSLGIGAAVVAGGVSIGAGIAAAPFAAGAYLSASQGGGAAESGMVGAGTTGAAMAGAVLGAGGGLVSHKLARRFTGREFGGRKWAAAVGGSVGAIVSAGLVGRGLAANMHAPRRLIAMQNAVPRRPEGGIQGMDL